MSPSNCWPDGSGFIAALLISTSIDTPAMLLASASTEAPSVWSSACTVTWPPEPAASSFSSVASAGLRQQA